MKRCFRLVKQCLINRAKAGNLVVDHYILTVGHYMTVMAFYVRSHLYSFASANINETEKAEYETTDYFITDTSSLFASSDTSGAGASYGEWHCDRSYVG